jgi:hypothetical protein
MATIWAISMNSSEPALMLMKTSDRSERRVLPERARYLTRP